MSNFYSPRSIVPNSLLRTTSVSRELPATSLPLIDQFISTAKRTIPTFGLPSPRSYKGLTLSATAPVATAAPSRPHSYIDR